MSAAIAAALRPVEGRLIGVAIPGDLLYHPDDVRQWTTAAGAEYREMTSLRGHDGFLLEGEQVSALLRAVLGADESAMAHRALRRTRSGETKTASR